MAAEAKPTIVPASFGRRLRRGTILPPTARNFDVAIWQAELKAAQLPSDLELIRTGLWFYDALQVRWTRLQELGLTDLPMADLSRHVVGTANLMHLRTDALLLKASLAADRPGLPFGSMSHVKLADGDGGGATADMIRTSTLDTLGKFVGYIRDAISPGRGRARLDEALLRKAYPLFEDIYLLEYLWGRIAWCGWRMTEVAERLRFMPPEPDPMGNSFVVAEHRREQLLAEFLTVYAAEWSALGSLLPSAWKVSVRKRPDGFSFDTQPVPAGEGPIPSGYVLGELLQATELAPYLDDPLPLLGEVAISLRDLVSAWALLALGAEGLSDHLLAKGPAAPPSAFAPSVRLTELHSLLDPLGWEAAKCSAVLDFFVYEGHALDGLWSKPLVPIAAGRVVPALTPLICPNLMRTAELWLTEGAGDAFFTKRGNEAEERLRHDIAAALVDRPWRSSVDVLQTPWVPKIGGVRRDIDLVVRIGETVFVGEMKLKKYPVSAAEIGRHTAEFDHAAEQLDIRLTWLADNKTLLASKTGFQGDTKSLAIEGVIVSGTAFGSGTRAGGYPVIDRDALLFFFENDAFMVAARGRRETGYVGEAVKPSHALPLVENNAAASFLAYVRDPLHVRYAEMGLVMDTRVNVLKATGQTIEWAEPHVDGALLGPGHADTLAHAMRTMWRDRQAKAQRAKS